MATNHDEVSFELAVCSLLVVDDEGLVHDHDGRWLDEDLVDVDLLLERRSTSALHRALSCAGGR